MAGTPRADVTLSVVIATWNSREFVAPCLRALAAQGPEPPQVVIVDNGSRDDTVAVARHAWPAVEVVANDANVGHCRAINQGVRRARGRYVCVLDVDTVCAPGALAQLAAFLDGRPDVAIVAPRMLNRDGSVQETARRFPGVLNGLFGRQTLLTRIWPSNPISLRYLQREDRDATAPFRVDWVSAACMLYRRSLVEQLGEWDEGFQGYWVDADWCRRAHAAGAIYCVPAARVLHDEQNRGGRRKSPARIRQFHDGAARFYRKHYTRGATDPRAIAASTALGLRAALLIAGNALRPDDAPARLPSATRPHDH